MDMELLIGLMCRQMARDLMVLWVCGMGMLAAVWLLVHHARLIHSGRKES